jgi:hypothetical protein
MMNMDNYFFYGGPKMLDGLCWALKIRTLYNFDKMDRESAVANNLLLPLSLRLCAYHKFNLIYRKYV